MEKGDNDMTVVVFDLTVTLDTTALQTFLNENPSIQIERMTTIGTAVLLIYREEELA